MSADLQDHSSGDPPRPAMETTVAPMRIRLPARRPALIHDIEIGDCRATVTIGFDGANRPREIFLVAGRGGSDMAKILDDVAVLISIALQHDIAASVLGKSVGRLPPAALLPSDLDLPGDDRDRPAATVIGVVLDLLQQLESSAADHGAAV